MPISYVQYTREPRPNMPGDPPRWTFRSQRTIREEFHQLGMLSDSAVAWCQPNDLWPVLSAANAARDYMAGDTGFCVRTLAREFAKGD